MAQRADDASISPDGWRAWACTSTLCGRAWAAESSNTSVLTGISGRSLWVPVTRWGARLAESGCRLGGVRRESGRVEAEVVHVWSAVVERSGCLAVLVDESAAGGMMSDRSAGPILDNFRIVRCALLKTAMRSVRVVVLDVLVEELFELLGRSR